MKRKTWSRKFETNILRVYNSARPSEIAEGMVWYSNGHEYALTLAEKYNLTVEQTCGVIAAISPGSAWGVNVLNAEQLCKEFTEGRKLSCVGSYGWRNVYKAKRILNGHDPLDVFPLTSPKVRAFYACLASPKTSQEVCIDRHAKCAAYGVMADRDSVSVVRNSEFTALAWHYARLANRHNLLPHQFQAIVWVAWRRILDEFDHSSMSFDFEALEAELSHGK